MTAIKFDKSVIGISIGISFEKKFSLCDSFGDIVDLILNYEKCRFGPKLFPRVESSFEHRTLFDPESINKFSISNSNCVFEYDFPDPWASPQSRTTGQRN